jgi:hypothetical protein
MRALAMIGAIALAASATGVAAPPGETMSDKLREAIADGLILMATVFVNTGAAVTTNRFTQAGTAPKNIGWGTGTGAAAVGDTALGTEVAPTTAGGRTVGTESRTTITNANDNYQVAGTVTQNQAGPVAITESGLFDAVTAGNLFIRSVFAAVNTSLNDDIAFTFGLKFVPG